MYEVGIETPVVNCYSSQDLHQIRLAMFTVMGLYEESLTL